MRQKNNNETLKSKAKMVDASPTISIIQLRVNGLNSPIKSQTEFLKK